MGFTILKLSDAWSYTAEADNLLQVARELERRGHRVVLACKPDTPLAERALGVGVEIREVPGFRAGWNLLRAAGAAPAVRRVLQTLQPDIIHAYRSSVHTLALGARAFSGVRPPLVRTRANAEPPRRGPVNRLLYERWTDRTIVAADVIRRMLADAGFRADRLVLIPGAVDAERFRPRPGERVAVRAELGLPEDVLVLGCVARIAPVKGHRVLLDAVARLHSNVRLVLVGQAWPGMEAKLRGWIADNALEPKVTWTGRRDDVERLMAAFDIGVVASVGSEALSRATLEYMATGLPVVATQVGGIPELLDEQVGMLVPPEDTESLTRALEALAADPDRRETLGRAARARVQARYTIQRQVDRLLETYTDLLRKPA